MIFFSPRIPLVIGLLAFAMGWANISSSPIEGVHAIRQADTLFAGWSYCRENTEFLKPKIAHRGDTSGVSIGEFPLASMVFALPCKLTGTWNEGAVKTIVLLLLLLNAGLWGTFLRRRWPERWPGWDWFLLVWLFSTHTLLHFTIALPDPLAFALIATAGLGFQAARDSKGPYLGAILCRLGASALFVIAFGMRPYLVPLLPLVIPGRPWRVGTVIACALFYLLWFKWWILQSEVSYYATEATAFKETAEKAGPILWALIEAVLRNALNFVGLWWLIAAFRAQKDRTMMWLWLGSFALVLALRAPMIINHKYYLGAAMLLTTIWCLWGVRRAPGWLAWIYLLVGVVNTQHYWHGKNVMAMRRVETEITRHELAPDEKIAIYIGESQPVTYFYWAKRPGWGFLSKDFRGLDHCPPAAAWALIETDQGPSLEPCVH